MQRTHDTLHAVAFRGRHSRVAWLEASHSTICFSWFQLLFAAIGLNHDTGRSGRQGLPVLSIAAGNPQDVVGSVVVEVPGKDEQVIGEAVDVAHRGRVHWFAFGQFAD